MTDEVRLLLGDTDPARPLLTDPEVEYFVGKGNGTAIQGAWYAVQTLIARYSQKITVSVGPASVQYRSMYQQLKELEATLESQGGRPGSINVGSPIDYSQYTPSVIGSVDWSNHRDS